MIKVCFVSMYARHLFDPREVAAFGGAELQLYYMATEMAKDEGFDVAFITGGPPGEGGRHQGVRLLFKENAGGMKYARRMRNYRRLQTAMKRSGAQVFIQRAAGVLTGAVSLFARIQGSRFVYMTAADLDISRRGTHGWMPPGLDGWLMWEIYKTGLRGADLVVVQHEKQKEEIARVFGREGLVRASAHRIPPLEDRVNKEGVLWVSRCDEVKRPELYLDLARAFPAERFVMVCPQANDEEYHRRIRDQARKISNLVFHDFVPFDEIDRFFRGAKVFINTSRDEGFPNSFVQSFKYLTAVLSHVVDPGGLLRTRGLGRCAGGDPVRFREQLRELLDNDAEREMTARRAYHHAREHHDIEKVTVQDKAMLRRLVEGEGAGSP